MTNKEINALKAELKEVKEISDILKNNHSELTSKYYELLKERNRLSYRLDACLYSMVLMQHIVRDQTNKNNNDLSLAT